MSDQFAYATTERWTKAAGRPVPDSILNVFEGLRNRKDRAVKFVADIDQLIPNGLFEACDNEPALAQILGGNDEFADSLCQNASLIAAFREQGIRAKTPDFGAIVGEGLRMLEHVSGYAAALDQLRALKQRTLIHAAVTWLNEATPPIVISQQVSTIADALVKLASEAVWREFCQQEGRADQNPVTFAAIGAWGQQFLELDNPLSVVSLVEGLKTPDNVRAVRRFYAMFVRAMSEPMARGVLWKLEPNPLCGPLNPLIIDPSSIPAIYGSLGVVDLRRLRWGRRLAGPSEPLDSLLDAIGRDTQMSSPEAARWLRWSDGLEATIALTSGDVDAQDRIDHCLHHSNAENVVTRIFAGKIHPSDDLARSVVDKWKIERPSIITRAPRPRPSIAPLAWNSALQEAWESGELQARPGPFRVSASTAPHVLGGALNYQVGATLVSGDKAGSTWTENVDVALQNLAGGQPIFDVIALGDYARHRILPGDPIRIFFLVESAEALEDADITARSFLARVREASQVARALRVEVSFASPAGIDPIVRVEEGLRLRSLSGMSEDDRLDLCAARTVVGRTSAQLALRSLAHEAPFTPERLSRMLEVKQRLEKDAVSQKHARRHLRLGVGGLADIEWFLKLFEARFPTATGALENETDLDRIHGLYRARLIHFGEKEILIEAFNWIQRVREGLLGLGFGADVIPENPDKLDHLAKRLVIGSGNELLRNHESIVDQVRVIYNQGIKRLSA